MSTIEKQFNAAANVIRSLPKNGSYQPSPEMQLKFYAFYKQATEGMCSSPKPGFWEVVKKAKWEAWTKLGNMPKEEAMNNYINELKKIVETMSYTEDVASFMNVLGPFYEVVELEERQHSQPDIRMEIEKSSVKCNGKLPLGEGDHNANSIDSFNVSEEPRRVDSGDMEETLSNSDEKPSVTNGYLSDKFYTDTESEDEYSDTVEVTIDASTNLHDSGASSSNHIVSACSHTGKVIIENGHDELWAVLPDCQGEVMEWVVSDNKHDVATNDVSVVKQDRLPVGKQQLNSLYPLSHPSSVPVFQQGGGQDTRTKGSGAVRSPSRSSSRTQNQSSFYSHDQPCSSPSVGGAAGGYPPGSFPPHRGEVNAQIALTLERLHRDMEHVLSRLTTLEALATSQQQNYVKRWWPFPDLSPRTALFLLTWPFVAHFILRLLRRRQRYSV